MTILVTGATGTVGRQVVRHLLERGLPVRALTRDPAAADLPAEVEVFPGDLTDTGTLQAAFDGVTAVHLLNFSDGYQLIRNGPQIVDLAVRAGVRRDTSAGPGQHVCELGRDGTVVQRVDKGRLQIDGRNRDHRETVLDWKRHRRFKNALRMRKP